jgi:hypothetical protein
MLKFVAVDFGEVPIVPTGAQVGAVIRHRPPSEPEHLPPDRLRQLILSIVRIQV